MGEKIPLCVVKENSNGQFSPVNNNPNNNSIPTTTTTTTTTTVANAQSTNNNHQNNNFEQNEKKIHSKISPVFSSDDTSKQSPRKKPKLERSETIAIQSSKFLPVNDEEDDEKTASTAKLHPQDQERIDNERKRKLEQLKQQNQIGIQNRFKYKCNMGEDCFIIDPQHWRDYGHKDEESQDFQNQRQQQRQQSPQPKQKEFNNKTNNNKSIVHESKIEQHQQQQHQPLLSLSSTTITKPNQMILTFSSASLNSHQSDEIILDQNHQRRSNPPSPRRGSLSPRRSSPSPSASPDRRNLNQVINSTSFDPRKYLVTTDTQSHSSTTSSQNNNASNGLQMNNFSNFQISKFLDLQNQELIILVGAPASGKSTLCIRELTTLNYFRINRDSVGSMDECVRLCASQLAAQKSVVIDNTNPARSDRKRFISLAQNLGVLSIKCFLFDSPTELVQHLNVFRERQTEGVVKRIPKDAYDKYYGRFEMPNVEEGFVEIVKIPFIAKFDSERHRKLFLQK